MSSIDEVLVNYLRDKKDAKEAKFRFGSVQSAWEKLLSGGFDLVKLVSDKHYGFGKFMNEKELYLFDVKKNSDTGKIGKTYAEIAEPRGEFARNVGRVVHNTASTASKIMTN